MLYVNKTIVEIKKVIESSIKLNIARKKSDSITEISLLKTETKSVL